MAKKKTVQGTYQMTKELKMLMMKFMADNNYTKFPDAALALIQAGLKLNKIK